MTQTNQNLFLSHETAWGKQSRADKVVLPPRSCLETLVSQNHHPLGVTLTCMSRWYVIDSEF